MINSKEIKVKRFPKKDENIYKLTFFGGEGGGSRGFLGIFHSDSIIIPFGVT